ncbi:MAG: preprotein translocase subunit SecE [Candidatus Omnitrophica bacterium]|nr:preprotein translocase subunit SecE [Candidatus Omnitrophota bacterium]
MNLVQKPINFVKEVKVELSKVAWSSRHELMDSTLVVIAITTILGVFIGLVDVILSKFLSFLFR